MEDPCTTYCRDWVYGEYEIGWMECRTMDAIDGQSNDGTLYITPNNSSEKKHRVHNHVYHEKKSNVLAQREPW